MPSRHGADVHRVAGDGPESGVDTVILAGGAGTRMRSVDDPALRARPKSLLPIVVGGVCRTILDYQVDGLRGVKAARIAILVGDAPGRGGSAIRSHIAMRYQGQRYPMVMGERSPLGTAGAVRAMLRLTAADWLTVLPGDVIFPFSALPSAVRAHRRSKTPVTWLVSSTVRPGTQNAGRILVDARSATVAASYEAGARGPVVGAPEAARLTPMTSTGALILDAIAGRALLAEHLGETGAGDLYRDFLPWLLATGRTVGAYDVRSYAVHDLGTPERFARFAPRG